MVALAFTLARPPLTSGEIGHHMMVGPKVAPHGCDTAKLTHARGCDDLELARPTVIVPISTMQATRLDPKC